MIHLKKNHRVYNPNPSQTFSNATYPQPFVHALPPGCYGYFFTYVLGVFRCGSLSGQSILILIHYLTRIFHVLLGSFSWMMTVLSISHGSRRGFGWLASQQLKSYWRSAGSRPTPSLGNIGSSLSLTLSIWKCLLLESMVPGAALWRHGVQLRPLSGHYYKIQWDEIHRGKGAPTGGRWFRFRFLYYVVLCIVPCCSFLFR